MKKTYVRPFTEMHAIKISESILGASQSGAESLYDDTADGNESLSRRHYALWDVDDELEDDDF